MTLRRTRLLLASALATGAAATLQLPAHATEVPADQRLQVTRAMGLVGGGKDVLGVGLAFTPDAPAGTVVEATISSCGHTLITRSATIDAGEKPAIIVSMFELEVPNPYMPTPLWPAVGPQGSVYRGTITVASDFLGPVWEYSVVVTHPGLDPYTLTGSSTVEGLTPARTCPELNSKFDATIGVKQWGTFSGRPRAGHRFALSPVLARGARVSYQWRIYAGGKKPVISTKRSVHLKRDYKGRAIELLVKVKQAGKRTVQQVTAVMVR